MLKIESHPVNAWPPSMIDRVYNTLSLKKGSRIKHIIDLYCDVDLTKDEMCELIIVTWWGVAIAAATLIELDKNYQFAPSTHDESNKKCNLNIFVKKSWRRKGIGSMVVDFAKIIARHHGCTALVVSSWSTHAKKFYDAVGVDKTDEVLL